MKIAIVYDRINKFGGAEQVLLAMHEIWPDAPLFTAVYNPATAGWANVFRIVPSFLNSVPIARWHHELFPWLTPIAFESFSFDEYDVVISVTSAEAKTIITKPQTLHICYCLTPTRYLWSGYETYRKRPGFGIFDTAALWTLSVMKNRLQRWDFIASQRPDVYIAISEQVKERIGTYYHRNVSKVIYPPVNTAFFQRGIQSQSKNSVSYLVVSRLVGYKRIDLLVDAFNILGIPLTIIGTGKDYAYLKHKAKSNIHFVPQKLTDRILARYYQECSAFIFAGQEDFGIVAAEAQACGKPVLCYQNSGMAEIISPGKTGEFFTEQSVDAIVKAVRIFDPKRYAPEVCREQSLKFDTIRFRKELKEGVKEYYEMYNIRRRSRNEAMAIISKKITETI
jgi:glycosyltransferase involved in cell wall biosynthesis